jgi:integrase/recombinase XerD
LRQVGIPIPERSLHAMRHMFAVEHLRRGGSVFHLQKVLGHSSLEMNRRYAKIMTEGLQRMHRQASLLRR